MRLQIRPTQTKTLIRTNYTAESCTGILENLAAAGRRGFLR